jgi:hypothetical protein
LHNRRTQWHFVGLEFESWSRRPFETQGDKSIGSGVAATIPPDDVEPALGLLSLFESHGRTDPRAATDWMRRIVGWARFRVLDGEIYPNA